MTDTEFATWLRSVRHADSHADCVRIEAEVNQREHLRDLERAPWSEEVHHAFGEAAH